MKDIEVEALAGEVNKFVSERLEPVSEKVSELTERLDDIAKQPAPVNGQDGKDGEDGAKGDTGEKGADGLGLDIPVWVEGVYREGAIVQANFGQAFRALADTAKGVDSEDWERIGTHGFRLTGPYSADNTYQPGDLFIKDFGLFLHDGNEAKLIAGRGPEGKKGKQGLAGKDGADGQDGADGKDGSQIEAMEIKDTSLVLVVKDADGEVKSFDTDLAPFLDAAVEVTKSLTEDTTKAQASEVEAQVKNLWNHLNEHITDQQAIPVRFYRGLWLPSTAYQAGDMVTYSSGQYLCRQSNTGVMPFGQLARDINSGDYWVQFSSGSGGGTGEAGDMPTRITTDMVKTNPSVTFRDSMGRFKTKVDVSGLTDQLKVNRFIADELDALVVSDSDLQKQIDELAEYHKEPAPEPTREPIYAEDEPTEYPHAKDGEPTDLQVDDQWYEVTDPDFDYDNPDPEGLDLYIWTQEGADFKWVLFVPEEVDEYVKKTGDEMTGDLEMVKTDGVDPKIHTRWIDSSENSNLHLQHNGNTRIYVGRDEVAITKPVKLGQQGVEDDHAVSKLYVDNADRHLQTKIDELEAELDVIAPTLEAAQYTYVDSPVVKAGEMNIASNTFTSGTDLVFFNDTALDGKQHTWAALNEGDYLEITDTLEVENRTAEDYAMYLVTKAPEGTGMKQIEVALVKGHGVPHVGDTMDAKAFQLGGNDINDLDARYALKNHDHDEFINNGGDTELTETTRILANPAGKWMNIENAADSSSGFFVFRDYGGKNNLMQVRGDGQILLKPGRMASDADEVTTKRYVDSVSGGGAATHPGRRFKFERYGAGTGVNYGTFSPQNVSDMQQSLFFHYKDVDGMGILEGSPDFTPSINMGITIYQDFDGTWKGVGFAYWGFGKTDYRNATVIIPVTWKQKPVLVAGKIYAIVVSGRW